jgi:hypothetical protein
MALIKEDFEKETLEAWRTYTAALENSLEKLEQDINEASEMSDSCTGEWCAATEHVIDELGKGLLLCLFSPAPRPNRFRTSLPL